MTSFLPCTMRSAINERKNLSDIRWKNASTIIVLIYFLLSQLGSSEAAFASAPVIAPNSLVAGATDVCTVTATIGTDLPNDGKFIFEFPSTFSSVQTTTAGNINGRWIILDDVVDGAFIRIHDLFRFFAICVKN